MRGDIYIDERERRKRRRFLKFKIYAVVFLFSILLVGVAYVIIYSQLFQIKNIIQVNGDLTPADADQLIGNLKNFFVSQSKIAGFLGSDNILIWNKEILAKFPKAPEIAELTIEKDYFKREIKINVKKREKFGVWCVTAQKYAEFTQNNAEVPRDSESSQRESAEQCSWFDKKGVIFAETPQLEGQLINRVEDFSSRTLELGDLVLEEKFLPNLIKIFDVLDKSGLKIKSLRLEDLQFQEIIADSLSDSLPKIYFSLRFDPTSNLVAVESLKSFGLEKIEYVDLRVENRAYYKIK